MPVVSAGGGFASRAHCHRRGLRRGGRHTLRVPADQAATWQHLFFHSLLVIVLILRLLCESERLLGAVAGETMAASIGGRHRGARRQREVSVPVPPVPGEWLISAPKGRHLALCATCHGDIPPRAPRIRKGAQYARVHHPGCVAARCGPPAALKGWADIDPPAQAAALAQFEGSAAAHGGLDAPMLDADGIDASGAVQNIPPDPGMEEKVLQHMDFWAGVRWNSLHDPIRTIDCVPAMVRLPVAELRGAIASAALLPGAASQQEKYLKAFFFLDRLLFAAVRSRRGGKRGQKGETIARTIARRIRMVWSGSWSALWEESEGDQDWCWLGGHRGAAVGSRLAKH